jgi:hypothetical protein
VDIWYRELALREHAGGGLSARTFGAPAVAQQMEAKAQRLDREAAETRRKLEMELREKELAESEKLSGDRSLLGRTKKYVTALKGIFPSMPKDSAELLVYFDSGENLLKLYDVPTDIQSKLSISQLTDKPKSIVSKLFLAQLNDYLEVKSCILTEF